MSWDRLAAIDQLTKMLKRVHGAPVHVRLLPRIFGGMTHDYKSLRLTESGAWILDLDLPLTSSLNYSKLFGLGLANVWPQQDIFLSFISNWERGLAEIGKGVVDIPEWLNFINWLLHKMMSNKLVSRHGVRVYQL